MEYRNFENKIYLRLDKDDEVISSIAEVCKKENIHTASISGIGGCGEIETGTFNLEKKDYIIQRKSGMFEMISLMGNISLKDNNIFPHVHALFSYIDENGNSKLIGGHLKKAVIILTGEIIIDPVNNGEINRAYNTTSGISVWQF